MATVPNDIIVAPNSHKYKEESKKREKLEPMIKKEQLAKKGLRKKFSDAFLSDDVDSLGKYIWQDMVIPQAKNFLLNALQYCFFHETGYRDFGRDDKKYYESYSSYYGGKSYGNRSGRREREEREDYRRREPNWKNIVLNHLDDAEAIVSRLRRQIEETGDVSIAQLYNLVDLPSDYTDMNWGWIRTNDIGIRRVSRGGYLIDLAEPRYLD